MSRSGWRGLGRVMSSGRIDRVALAGTVVLGLRALARRLGGPVRRASTRHSGTAPNRAALWTAPSDALARTSRPWARVESDRA